MNKLLCIDLVMVAAVLALIFIQPGKISDVLTGFIAVIFVISLTNHVKNYITSKKFY
jgi:NADH:ubiquinone oxidoreductase subunit K